MKFYVNNFLGDQNTFNILIYVVINLRKLSAKNFADRGHVGTLAEDFKISITFSPILEIERNYR